MQRKILVGTIVVSAGVMLAMYNVLGGQSENIPIPPVPEALRGRWEVTVVYRDPTTGAVRSTDVTTTSICPGEPIVPPLYNTLLHTSGEVSNSRVRFSCNAKHSPTPGCNVFVEGDLDSNLDGDQWSGTGGWRASVVGECEHVDFGEDVELSGRRLSGDASCGVPESLLHRAFPHAALVPVLARRLE